MNVLIAYFSHGGENIVDGELVDLKGNGNTKRAAEALCEVLKSKGAPTQIYEIEPRVPYPFSYAECDLRSRQEYQDNILTPIHDGPNGFEHYDAIFLGFPNWYGTIPSPVRTFLKEHDCSGKTLFPFVTHGGHRFLLSIADIQAEAKGAEVIEGFAIDAAYIDQAEKVVKTWVDEYGMILGL